MAMGDAAAMNGIAIMHEYGRGVPKDAEKAAEWYRKAAEAGNGHAMTMVAGRLKDAKNFVEAAKWYGRAAALRGPGARLSQAQMIGLAAERDRALAMYQEILDEDPQDLQAWLEMGMELQAGKRIEAAKAAYRKAIELEAVGGGGAASQARSRLRALEAAENPRRNAD